MFDIEKKLADIESAYIQGLITMEEYTANRKKILSQYKIPNRMRTIDTKDWDCSGLCGVSAFNPRKTIYEDKGVKHDKDWWRQQ